MKMTGAQILLDGLVKEGVDVVFGILGGAVLPLYDTLPQFPQIHHVLVRHEQCAAHAAEGYARASGKVGVCFATSGPGATNLVTGIANAYLDSTPIVAITGQVARRFIGKDSFQEVDITGITLPITKHNYLVRDTTALAKTVKEAFHIARTGRPGPVLIDIPKDVFTEEVEYHAPGKVDISSYKVNLKGHPAQIQKAAAMINSAQKPLIIAGRGVIVSGAFAELKELAEKAQIPVVTASKPSPPAQVRARYTRLKPLREIKAIHRGWTLDVLNILRHLGRPEFTNEEVYAFDRALEALHPGNRHIRPKIRQQLQILRDSGLLLHIGNGRWSLV